MKIRKRYLVIRKRIRGWESAPPPSQSMQSHISNPIRPKRDMGLGTLVGPLDVRHQGDRHRALASRRSPDSRTHHKISIDSRSPRFVFVPGQIQLIQSQASGRRLSSLMHIGSPPSLQRAHVATRPEVPSRAVHGHRRSTLDLIRLRANGMTQTLSIIRTMTA